MRHSRCLAACLAFAIAVALGRAEAQDTAPPPHWRIAYDSKPATNPVFVKMPPGFHVTMGPGAVLWDPRVPGDARFEVRGEVFVFPNSSDGEVAVMIGGRALGTPRASWTAFAIRRDGAVGILQRRDGATSTLRPWATHAAIKAASGEEPALNALVVRVDSAVTFSVNGALVAQLSREQIGVTDGTTGWRVGAGVNLHISTFDVLRQLAPARNAAPSAPRSQTVFVVRHAERESRERDSDLSADGRARAQALDSALADARLTHVIVTEFKRTANTGAPAAARHGLTPIVIANQPDVAKHAAAVAAAVRAAGPDAVVLVVGHSNTVSPIVAALGGPPRPDLCDAQYSTLTVVRLEGSGVPPRVARVNYGAPDAARCADAGGMMR